MSFHPLKTHQHLRSDRNTYVLVEYLAVVSSIYFSKTCIVYVYIVASNLLPYMGQFGK
jgi:hypothetical protein